MIRSAREVRIRAEVEHWFEDERSLAISSSVQKMSRVFLQNCLKGKALLSPKIATPLRMESCGMQWPRNVITMCSCLFWEIIIAIVTMSNHTCWLIRAQNGSLSVMRDVWYGLQTEVPTVQAIIALRFIHFQSSSGKRLVLLRLFWIHNYLYLFSRRVVSLLFKCLPPQCLAPVRWCDRYIVPDIKKTGTSLQRAQYIEDSHKFIQPPL